MGRAIRAFDWASTPLGPAARWSEELRCAVRLVLASREPLCVWWGEARINIHNDACRELLGANAASALGTPAPAAWATLWGRLGEVADAAQRRGDGFVSEPIGIPIERDGQIVEAHYSVSASPICEDTRQGLLCTFVDRTPRVVAERRIELLRELACRSRATHSVEAACVRAIEGLATDPFDIPFAGIYLVDTAAGRAYLTSVTGIPAGHAAMPSEIVLDEQARFPLREAIGSGEIQGIRFDAWAAPLPPGAWMRPVREGFLACLGPAGGGRDAVLVAALSPLRSLDDELRRYLQVVASQAAAGLANAQARDVRRDELEAQVDSLTMMHELSMKLGAMTDLAPAMQAILDTAVSVQGAQMGIVWLQDPESGDLVAAASHGFEGEKLMLFQRVPVGPEGGSAGNAFHQRRRWVVEDTDADPSFAPYRDAAREAGFRAVHSTPIVTRSGALLGVLSVHHGKRHAPAQRDRQVADVCARHAADAVEALRNQEALRESERLYRAIGESIDYGVWVCDAEGRNTYASDSFLKMTGMTQEQCSGFGWGDVLHPDDMGHTMAAWRKCVKEGGAWDMEYRVRGVDGQWHSVLARGAPVKSARGAIVAWAGINLDIRRLKQVENELRELDQRKNEFLATLAHELRNPLAPLRNGLEVMRLASGNPQTVEKARCMMERQLGQMVRLVDDLLDVSRVSRGKIELRRERVDLAKVLRNALETSQPLIGERGHTFVVNMPPERVMVSADVTRLSQVFWNLLNNAAKYTHAAGRVELSVRPGDGWAEVSIADNGIGIPPDMQARVFDIFTQVDRSLEKSQGGLGIGLSIAKRLVEMHGGTISVKSEGHGKGSEFIVRLPATIETRLPTDDGAATRPTPGGPRHRILVADDNHDSATTLSLMLEVMGHEVRVARDGQEAVDLADEFRPEAILMDIGMPRMNGYDACKCIRGQPWASRAFIVALTGWGQDDDKNRSRAAGFDRHLVKPVEPVMLENLIRALPVSSLPPH
ncbi:MAG TPA: ATP-binding protein [Usitatibacter sp.]|nr:ATP-binding protein [Usitatibacter sp.]